MFLTEARRPATDAIAGDDWRRVTCTGAHGLSPRLELQSLVASPPKVGAVSSDTFDRPAPDAAVAEMKLKLPLPSVDNN